MDVDQALFQPFPSEIVFQKFHPHQTIEVPLTFRNLDRVSKIVLVNCKSGIVQSTHLITCA